MFQIGDYVVCPGHGVAQIFDIEAKEVGGNTLTFYIIKIVANGMTVMVPTGSSNDAVRGLSGQDDISKVYELLHDHDVKVDTSTWNRRYREYMLKIKTGSILEIADVLRSLFLLKKKKNLSFGEKKMLDQCCDLLSQEIALSNGSIKSEIQNQINSCFN